MPQRTLSESEFNAIKQHVLDSLPAGLSEEDFNRIVPSKMAQALGEAESLPAAPEGSSVGRFVSNAASMLNPIAAAQSVYQAVRHPIDTVTNIGADMAAQGAQAVQAAREGRNWEAIGHGAAAALPVIGPAAARAGEQIASGDVAGGLGAGAGLIAPVAATAAVRAAGKAKGLIPLSDRELLAQRLDKIAAERVSDVMRPKVGANKVRFGNMAEQVAPSLAKAPDGAAWSREGLHAQVSARLEQAESALDEAANQRLSTRTFPTRPIIDDLLEKRRRLTAEAVEGSRITPSYAEPARIAGSDISGASAGRAVSAGAQPVAAGPRTFRSTEPSSLFHEAVSEARRLGYDGMDGTLRASLDHALEQAKALRNDLIDLHNEHGPQALLKAISQYGGIGADDVYSGEIAQLWENSTGTVVPKGSIKDATRLKRPRTLSSGGIGGVPGVLKKSGGLSLDHMAESLRQDPRFANITGPNELLAAIDEARTSTAKIPSLQETMQMVGLRPGVRWWEGENWDAKIADKADEVRELAKQGRPIGVDVVPEPNQVRVAQIDKAISEIKRLGPVARYEPLRRIREAYDAPARAVYSPAVTTDFLKAQGGKLGAADVTGTLREALAKFDPETAKANAEYSLYRKADDVLSATAEVERTRPKVGRQIMARLTGSVVGEQAAGVPGAVAGFLLGPALDAAINSGVTTKLQTAKLMTRLADAVRKGDVGHVTSLSYQLKKLAAQGAAVEATSPNGSQTQPIGASR